jgi:hypothetical protein
VLVVGTIHQEPEWQKQALFKDYRTVPFRMTRRAL